MKKLLDKLEYNSPVTLTFAGVSLLVLALGYLSKGAISTRLFCVYRAPWTDPLTYFRVFAHVLGHADLEHYVSNMMMLLLIGPLVEEKYGSKILAGMILVTALVTGLCNMLFFESGLLGASGIVFMLILLAATSSMKGDKIPITLILVLIFYIGGQIYSGLFTKDNIAQFAHIIGGMCGFGFGYLELKIKKREKFS